jgi:hypothetical protein
MATPSEIHEHFKKGEREMNEFIKENAPDGVHDNIEFNEYRNPEYWMKRRMRRAFMENVVPALIVVLTFVAYVIIAAIDGTL